jgi:hypothetical protein
MTAQPAPTNLNDRRPGNRLLRVALCLNLLGFAAVQVLVAEEASTNAATEFKLLSQTPATQASPAPESSSATGGVLRLPTVQVTYSGISATWARRMGRVLAEARSHAQRDFGFNMPDMIRLTVTVGSNRYELFNDCRDQLTYHLRSEGDLAGFEFNHWYFLYGMCHEVGHLAMYRTFKSSYGNAWLNWDGQEAWAHYCGERLADLSYRPCVSEFWPGQGVQGEQMAERQSAQNFFPLGEKQLAEHWRALDDIVGERGIQPLFEIWNKASIDPQHRAAAVSRTFTGHPKAERLQGWWLKAAPLMLIGPGKSALPPVGPPNPASGSQPNT